MLIPVPGDSLKVKAEDAPGPGGVLLCAENFIMYMNEGHETISCLIPRRSNLPDHRGILLTTSATHKIPGQFVILAQSEYGDIYKVSCDCCHRLLIPVRYTACLQWDGFRVIYHLLKPCSSDYRMVRSFSTEVSVHFTCAR